MIVFFTLLLTVLTFAWVAYPLLKRGSTRPVGAEEDDNLRELSSRRDTTYAMLKELQFDYQSGILSRDDYNELQNRYKHRAASILKDIDYRQRETSTDEDIEKQVLALRQDRAGFCPQCGAGHRAEDRFCSRCGSGLPGAAE